MFEWEQLGTTSNKYLKKLNDAGYKVLISSNFKKLHILAKQKERSLTPHFCVKQNTFFRGEAFWVGVYDGEHCFAWLAVKMMPVGNEGLLKYSKRYWKRIYKQGSTSRILFSDNQLKKMSSIKGNLIYSGEWFVDPAYTKNNIGGALANYTICLSFAHWREADFFYIFMRNKDVLYGLPARLEPLNTHVPNALKWDSPPSQAQHDYWLLGASKTDVVDWCSFEN